MMTHERDPYTRPVFGYANKLARVAWWFCYITLFRISPKPMFGWRRFVLRLFGARLGRGVNIYPRVILWAPWNLRCDDRATIANEAEIYNPAMIILGSRAIVSQNAYLCGATHDYNDPSFPFRRQADHARRIRVGLRARQCDARRNPA